MDKSDLKLKIDMEDSKEVVKQLESGFHGRDILIQSFPPMKQAASTSILFAFTHNLEFNDPFYYPDKWYTWRESRKIFQDFMYRTLALRKGSHVKRLSLNLKISNNRCINHWIYYALKHGVSTLHICIDREMCFLSRVFTSNTLVKLSLGTAFDISSVPSYMSLPSLKVLLFDQIYFQHGQLSEFLAACPVLEDLTMHNMVFSSAYAVISCKTIKKLSFTNEYYNDLYLLFDTPSVVELYYSDYPPFNFPESSQFDLLVKTTLDLYLLWYPTNEHVERVKNLITVIRNVKSFHLTISAVKVSLVCCKDELPMLNNLVDLVFSSNKQGLRVLLPRLLECSPNLKRLALSGLHCYTFQKRRRFAGIRIPIKNKIEMPSIMQYQGSENELKHLSHVLLNMVFLKEVKVCVAATMDDKKKMQLAEVLMKLPTASSELKMQVI